MRWKMYKVFDVCHVDFLQKFIIIPIKGEMILFNGALNGINSIKRAGSATYDVRHGQIDVNTTFQFDELDVSIILNKNHE